jgi:hypothetical protein
MKQTVRLAMLAYCICGVASSARADFSADVREASEKITPLLVDASTMIGDGLCADANQKILAVFPEKSRTAAQAFVLGRALFTQDSGTSYQLHKRAAKELPNEPQVQFEWAMEQHRAGEYAGAAKSYAAYSTAHPKYAPAYGLCAECLLRLGKTTEAVAMWRKSAASPQETLNEFDALVCAVNSHLFPDRQRAVLLAKVADGELASAEKLISLDSAYETDWWNRRVERDYLKRDLQIVQKAKFADADRLKEIVYAANCCLAARRGARRVLLAEGYLVGSNPPLFQSNAMLSILLDRAGSDDGLRKRWGPAMLDRAKQSGDVDAFRAATKLYANSSQLPGIERLAWAATGDLGFAVSLLTRQHRLGELRLDDPVLMAASQKLPDDAVIAGLVVELTEKDKKPDRAALIHSLEKAIKAEYRHFSPDSRVAGVDAPGPRRRTSGGVFREAWTVG